MMDTNGATPPVLLATTENGELHHDGAVGDGAGALRDARKSSWSSSFQPLCFSKDALNRPNFDVDLFIADCRRRVPLESVLADLKQYRTTLESELVELINKDYADFVNLSANLAGIDKTIEALRQPLLQLRNEVASVHADVEQARLQLEQAIAVRKEIEQKKQWLHLLINVHDTLGKIEKLLQLDSDSSEDKHSVPKLLVRRDEESSNLIQRVANDFNQLKYYVSRGKHLPLVQALSHRIQVVERIVQEGLEALFNDGITSRQIDIVSNCLRTYAAIDRCKEAEAIFRSHFVDPFLAKCVTQERLEAGTRGSCKGLDGIYAEIVTFVKDGCSIVLQLAQRSLRGQGFDFLSNSIFPAITHAIQTNITIIFAPGIPHMFHSNYQSTLRFIASIEDLCASKSELQALRAHPAYSEFQRRWNLPVYFGLKFQEIAKKLESSLSIKHTLARREEPSTSFMLPPTQVLWECLFRCYEDETFLLPLAASFFKLSLQLLSRYTNWIRAGVTRLQLTSGTQGAASADQATSSSSNSAASSSSSSTTATSTTSTAASAASATPTKTASQEQSSDVSWADWLAADQYVLLVFDLEKLLSDLEEVYAYRVSQVLSTMPAELLANLQATFRNSDTNPIITAIAPLGDAICHRISEQCSGGLNHVRGIMQTYRMTNKECPTKASHYVKTVVKPLKDFLDGKDNEQAAIMKLIKPATKQHWATTICIALTQRFAALTQELLSTVQKQSSLLRKMTKAPTASASTPGAMSDDDKILVQLYLDVQEFAKAMSECGVKISQLEDYQRLFACVADAEKVMPPRAVV